jgi:isoamylase
VTRFYGKELAMANGQRIWPGEAFPLGATTGAGGTNFAVFSAVATQVTLCLFDDQQSETRIPLSEVDSFVWHGFVPGVGHGQRYGYRVDGPWDLSAPARCDPAKLLLDPYGLAVEGSVDWGRGPAHDEPLYDRRFADNSRSDLDSSPLMPRSIVVGRQFDWQDGGFSPRPLAATVIYECHVRGATMLHPDVPASLRGTYAGLAHPRFVQHLRSLGVTAVELMPVHQYVSEDFLVAAGRSNYWGYNSIGFFAPHNAYSSAGQRGEQVAEFKGMVQAFHQAGLEVILDVVFNHTAEGGQDGPSFCFRGLDNGSYYMIEAGGAVLDAAGVGNSMNIWDPAMLRLILDSLRYWVTDMHIDGFRFDLATVLSATDSGHSVSVFLDLVAQDPVLATVKLIAEPWNPGPEDPQYGLGRFPPAWSQWNDQFRNNVRTAWKSDTGLIPAFRDLFEGSPSIFQPADGTKPTGSVNYVSSHDGFTIRDLVCYTDDGQKAWDSGGPANSTDAGVSQIRASRQRAMIATLALAQGLPMLGHGDELGRTQAGNANAYDQDSPTSWIDWSTADSGLIEFTSHAFALRAAHPVFRQRRWTSGGTPGAAHQPLAWYGPNGQPAPADAATAGETVTVSVYLDGHAIPYPDATGKPVTDDDFLVLFNAWWQPLAMTVPPALGGAWSAELDSSQVTGLPATATEVAAGTAVMVSPRSMLVLRRTAP